MTNEVTYKDIITSEQEVYNVILTQVRVKSPSGFIQG